MFRGPSFIVSTMQEETTPIFKRLWYDWTQQQPGIEPTNPLGQCWVPPIVAFYDQQGLLRTYSLPRIPRQPARQNKTDPNKQQKLRTDNKDRNPRVRTPPPAKPSTCGQSAHVKTPPTKPTDESSSPAGTSDGRAKAHAEFIDMRIQDTVTAGFQVLQSEWKEQSVLPRARHPKKVQKIEKKSTPIGFDS